GPDEFVQRATRPPSFPGSAWERTARQAPPAAAPYEAQPSAPVGDDIEQPRHARVISRARISPMRRVIDVAAPKGIGMHILQLLHHRFVVPDLLWMTSFLPKLVRLIDFMMQLEKPQLVEQG